MADTPDFEEMYKELQASEQRKTEADARKQAPKKEKPEDDAVNRFIRDFITLGTPACGLLCAVIGLAIAGMLMTVGLWKTLLAALLAVIGAFVGGVFDKAQWLKDVINRLFPDRK